MAAAGIDRNQLINQLGHLMVGDTVQFRIQGLNAVENLKLKELLLFLLTQLLGGELLSGDRFEHIGLGTP
jgi:hypothetical protein